ncbi:MAG: hypothetical protein ABFD50_11625 [Smithella sp.]
MSTFLKYFMWFMIGDTVGSLTLLFWQGLCSINKREPARSMKKFDHVTQSPETLADFVEDINGSPSLCDFCIYKTYKECGSEALCHEGITEYLKQEVGEQNESFGSSC